MNTKIIELENLQNSKPSCPVCPACPAVGPIPPLVKPRILPEMMPPPPVPIIAPITPFISEFRLMGYLHKTCPGKKYKVVKLFGREARGNFFNYYVPYIIDNQEFKFQVSKGKRDDLSREIYDGDEIYLGSPFNAKYRFSESTLEHFCEDTIGDDYTGYDIDY